MSTTDLPREPSVNTICDVQEGEEIRERARLESDPQENDLKKNLSACPSQTIVDDESICGNEEDFNEEDFRVAIARCSELEDERQCLLRMKCFVTSSISKLTSFGDVDSHRGEDFSDDEDTAQDCSDEDAPDHVSDQMPVSELPLRSPTWAEYQDVLAEQAELEQEVEELKEALDIVAKAIATIAQKSLGLSDHLQDVGKEIEIRTDRSTNLPPIGKLDRNMCDITPTARWQIVSKILPALNKGKVEELSPLCFASIVGVTSGASSSTATPRSESASESQIPSARSAQLCEA